MKDLTPKQRRFCDEYLANGNNGYAAAVAAGYSPNSAKEIASENLTKPNIKKYISEKQEAITKRLGVTAERVISEAARIAFGDIGQLFNEDGTLKDLEDMDAYDRASISSIEVYEEKESNGEETFTAGFTKKIKLWDKMRALDMLGKYSGIYEKDHNQRGEAFKQRDLSKLTDEELKQMAAIEAKLNA